MGLSARAHDRILKVARTIADLGGAATVSAKHVAEAVPYRSLNRNYWSVKSSHARYRILRKVAPLLTLESPDHPMFKPPASPVVCGRLRTTARITLVAELDFR